MLPLQVWLVRYVESMLTEAADMHLSGALASLSNSPSRSSAQMKRMMAMMGHPSREAGRTE